MNPPRQGIDNGGSAQSHKLISEFNHVALVGHGPRQWRRVIFPFLAQGIAQGDKCIYLTDLHPPRLISTCLMTEGVSVEEKKTCGQFDIRDATQLFTPQGWFDPDEVLRNIESNLAGALRQRFQGLRLVMDMTWASYSPPGVKRLQEYERRVNRELPLSLGFKMICYYDERLFSPQLIAELELNHGTVIRPRDDFGVGPLPLSGRAEAPGHMDASRMEGRRKAVRHDGSRKPYICPGCGLS